MPSKEEEAEDEFLKLFAGSSSSLPRSVPGSAGAAPGGGGAPDSDLSAPPLPPPPDSPEPDDVPATVPWVPPRALPRILLGMPEGGAPSVRGKEFPLRICFGDELPLPIFWNVFFSLLVSCI